MIEEHKPAESGWLPGVLGTITWFEKYKELSNKKLAVILGKCSCRHLGKQD
jgi:hypothetical protein